MLTSLEKQQLFIKLHNVIRRNKSEDIISLLKNVSPEDQVWLLSAKSNIFAGTLPFLAATLGSKETFLALIANLPQSHYAEIFNILEDGNTPLTEALSWGRTSVIKSLLTQVENTTFECLLNTKNYEDSSLQVLLSEAKSECGNKNLLEDIEKIRAEKSFSPAAAMKAIGLYAKVEPKVEESEITLSPRSLRN